MCPLFLSMHCSKIETGITISNSPNHSDHLFCWTFHSFLDLFYNSNPHDSFTALFALDFCFWTCSFSCRANASIHLMTFSLWLASYWEYGDEMARTSKEIESTFLDDLKKTSGHSLNEWIRLIENMGVIGHGNVVDLLKTKYHLKHMEANLLILILGNNGKPIYN